MVVPDSTDPVVQQGASIFFSNPGLEDAFGKDPSIVQELLDCATVAVKNNQLKQIPGVLHDLVDITVGLTGSSQGLSVPSASTSGPPGQDPPAARHWQPFVSDKSEDEDEAIPWPHPLPAHQCPTAHAPPTTNPPPAVQHPPPAAACHQQPCVTDQSEDGSELEDLIWPPATCQHPIAHAPAATHQPPVAQDSPQAAGVSGPRRGYPGILSFVTFMRMGSVSSDGLMGLVHLDSASILQN
ncbi:hypothetical protein DXG01_001309 [Tephrocybe rancida]|nr:hypothetical protein DXG01_001309 [Tephrocybe rancida]